jgi:hypothetical protein
VRWRPTVQRLLVRFRRLPGLSAANKKDLS